MVSADDLKRRDFIEVVHQISFQVQDLQSLRAKKDRSMDRTRWTIYFYNVLYKFTLYMFLYYIYCTCVYVIIPWKNEVTTTTVLSRQCSKKDFLEQRRVKLVSHEALGDNRPYWTWEFIMARNPPASKLGGLMCQQRTQILDVIEGHIEFLSHPTHSIHSTS